MTTALALFATSTAGSVGLFDVAEGEDVPDGLEDDEMMSLSRVIYARARTATSLSI